MNVQRISSENYNQFLKEVSSFATVEDFWALHSHFKRTSSMPYGTTIYIFAEGTKPMWEDPACEKGGRLFLRVPKTHTNKYWEDLTLALIGEQFTNEEDVLGIQLQVKPGADVLSVWMRFGTEERVEQVKQDIQRLIMFDESSISLGFQDFQQKTESLKEKAEANPFNRSNPQIQGSNQEAQVTEEENKSEATQQKPRRNFGDNQNNNGGFERNQLNRGGGFTRGRGRGRGNDSNNFSRGGQSTSL